MEIYYMHKDDISVAHSTLALLMQLCSLQIVTITVGIISAVTNMDLLSSSFAVNDANACISVEAGDGLVVGAYMKLLVEQCITDAIYSVVFFFVTTWFLKNKLNLEYS